MSDLPSHITALLPRIPDDLVPFGTFARGLKVHVSTLHRQRRAPHDPMPAWKVLGRWYVSESEFAAWAGRRSGRGQVSGRVAADGHPSL
jgi:hypothetical protein